MPTRTKSKTPAQTPVKAKAKTKAIAKAASITVVALIQAKPGKTTALKRALTAMVAATRTEAGCLNYDLHQDTEDTRNFIFHENWTSEAHLSAHLDSPHLHAFRAQADELLAEPPKMWRAKRVA